MRQDQVVKVLDEIYDLVIKGIPKVSKPVEEFADEYLLQHVTVKEAASAFLKNQVVKCGTSGFLTGLGGITTLPLAISANVSSVWYMQLRMIAGLAYMGGFDIRSEEVKTLMYVCLTGSAAKETLKRIGLDVGTTITQEAVKKIPASVLMAVNERIGFSLLSHAGEAGLINLTKLVPVFGGVVGSLTDMSSTKDIGLNAYRVFINNRM